MKRSILKRIFLLQISLLFFLPIMGQDAVEEQIKQTAAQRVAQMNDYISFMADKTNDLTYCCASSSSLFRLP